MMGSANYFPYDLKSIFMSGKFREKGGKFKDSVQRCR